MLHSWRLSPSGFEARAYQTVAVWGASRDFESVSDHGRERPSRCRSQRTELEPERFATAIVVRRVSSGRRSGSQAEQEKRVRAGGPISNPQGSQGEQPPAASARIESPDGLEDQEKMVRVVGLEPTRACARGILNPLRLPVPPHPHRTYNAVPLWLEIALR